MSVSLNIMKNNTTTTLGDVIYNLDSIGILNLTYLDNSTHIVIFGENVTLYATLVDDMANPITGQNIIFYVNGIFVGNVTSIEGFANLTFTAIIPGTVPVNSIYEGTGDCLINIPTG